MNCIINFPVTQKNMRAEEKSRDKAKKERRKADMLVAVAVAIPAVAVIPEGAAATLALVPLTMATEI
jgi:hypothetical protein